MSERIVTVRNSAGHALHCMLQEPVSGRRKDLACILLSPGVKMRVAPHRLYRKLAAEFLDRGIAVLRVDFHGLGDSEGEVREEQLDQMYRQVQLGRHVDDVRSAMRWLEREMGVERAIVGGLCGGALTGLLASEHEPKIAALYAIGIPVVLDGTGAHVADNMTQAELKRWRNTALTKLFNPSAWLRLLTFRTDIRTLLRALFPSLRLGKRATQTVAAVPAPSQPLAANLNPHFARTFFGLLQANKPALLVFSGADRLQFEYQEKFETPWSAPLQKFAALLQVDIIAKANHVLGDPAWVAQARQLTGEWLQRRFP